MPPPPPFPPVVAHLREQVLVLVARLMIIAGTTINGLMAIALWQDVWVTHRFPPSVFFNQVASLILSNGVGAWLLYRRRVVPAIWAIVILASIGLLLGVIFTRQATTVVFACLVFPPTSLVLNKRLQIGFLLLLSSIYLLIVVAIPELQAQFWMRSLLMTWGMSASGAVVGNLIRQILERFAATLQDHEAEVTKRVRSEERAAVLEEHRQRLLAAQHDLRGPCNTLIGAVQLIQNPRLTPQVRDHLLHSLESLGVRLRGRIDALFDEAKAPILQRRADLPSIDLARTIHNYEATLTQLIRVIAQGEQHQATGPTLTIEPLPPSPIRARPGEIHRILENLILNSIAAGATQIVIRGSQPQGTIELRIDDTGQGFRPQLLESFPHHLHTSTARGTGLGLAGVYANVTAFAGTIHLENWAAGARVILRFPLCPTAKDNHDPDY